VAATGSLTVGVSISDNELTNDIEASITGADHLQNSGGGIGTVDIDAKQDNTINAFNISVIVSGAFSGAGSVAVGGGGATADNIIQNKMRAELVDSTVPMSVTVDAISDNTINSEIKSGTASIGGAPGVATGLSIGVVIASNHIGGLHISTEDSTGDLPQKLTDDSNQVIAEIRNSVLSGGDVLRVKSESTDVINAKVNGTSVAAAGGTTAASGLGAGAAAFNVIASDIDSSIQSSPLTNWAGSAPIQVKATDLATITSNVDSITVGAVGGLNAGSLSVSISRSENTVANEVTATLTDSIWDANSSSLDVSASTFFKADETPGDTSTTDETSRITTSAFSAAVAANISIGGSINGGGAIANSEIKSSAKATVEDSDLTLQDVNIFSNNYAAAESDTQGTDVTVALIGIGGGGSVVRTNITPTTHAGLTRSGIKSDSLSILATGKPSANGDAGGLRISTGLNVGVSQANLKLQGNIDAKLDSQSSVIDVGTLNVAATLSQSEQSLATVTSSSGGLLLGIEASKSSFTNQIDVNAQIADGATDVTAGDADVVAMRQTNQRAETAGVAGGLIAVGVTSATATTGGETTARIGDNVSLAASSLLIDADSHTKNFAHARSIGGGAIPVAVAVPKTINASTTKAEIGGQSTVTVAGDLEVFSDQTSEFNATLLATSGGLLTGGGGDLSNNVVSNVDAKFGENASVFSDNIQASATNRIVKDDSEFGHVDATTGGAIAGVGVTSNTLLTIDTTVDVGQGASLAPIEEMAQKQEQALARASLFTHSINLMSLTV
jgi:hypothetical protein